MTREDPICLQPNEVREKDSYIKQREGDNTGGYVWVTRFSDGSSIVHWGGPAGNTYYDQFGEEC